MPPPIKLFLSYAREDADCVSDLYSRLRGEGYEPWMDVHDILPGENWELAIYRAIRRADFFLSCLSPQSLGKRGMLQKELKHALAIWQERLDDDIYLIPVRLMQCEPPEPLRGFQRVDLFEDVGFGRLCTAIAVGASRSRGDAAQHTDGRVGIEVTIHELRETRSTHPKYDINIRYPHFYRASGPDLEEVNLQIKALAEREAQLCRAVVFDEVVEIRGETIIPSSSIDGECQVTLANNSVISVMFDYLAFRRPAAHPTKWRTACNFALNPVAAIGVDQIFSVSENEYPRLLLQRIRSELGLSAAQIEGLQVFNHQGYGSLNITSESLIFSYSGSFARGVQAIEIPLREIGSLLNPNGPLRYFVK